MLMITSKSMVNNNILRQYFESHTLVCSNFSLKRNSHHRRYIQLEVGDEDDDFLFTVDNNTYKLRDIFLPSSMLVTQQFE